MTRLYVALVRARRSGARATNAATCPGWVLITVMTAGLVMAIWGVARGELTSMLRDALGSVHN